MLGSSFSYACVGARPMGMGGAFIGVADDVNTTYWNPAGLGKIENFQITYTPTLYNRDEVCYDDFFSIVSPLKIGWEYWGGLGFGFVNRGLVWPDEWVCPYERRLKQRKWSQEWYWLSYGIELFEGFSLGINLRHMSDELSWKEWDEGWNRWIKERMDDSAFGTDLGLLWRPHNFFSFGVLYQNINVPDLYGIIKLIRNLRLGVAFRPDDRTIIALDMYDATEETRYTPIDVSRDLCFGIERWLTENFVVRGGAYFFTAEGRAITLGGGFRRCRSHVLNLSIQLDYTLLYWTDAPQDMDEFTHQIGLTAKY